MFGGAGIWLGLASLIVGVALGLTRPFPESWVCASIGVLAFVASVGGRLAMIPRQGREHLSGLEQSRLGAEGNLVQGNREQRNLERGNLVQGNRVQGNLEQTRERRQEQRQ
jgi:hypothetical protein